MDFKKSIYNLIVLLFGVEVSTYKTTFDADNFFRHYRNMSINCCSADKTSSHSYEYFTKLSVSQVPVYFFYFFPNPPQPTVTDFVSLF
jgi:hypothetical protein